MARKPRDIPESADAPDAAPGAPPEDGPADAPAKPRRRYVRNPPVAEAAEPAPKPRLGRPRKNPEPAPKPARKKFPKKPLPEAVLAKDEILRLDPPHLSNKMPWEDDEIHAQKLSKMTRGSHSAFRSSSFVKMFSKYLELGLPIDHACRCAGIDRATYYNFVSKNPEAGSYFESLQEKPTLAARKNLVAAIKGNRKRGIEPDLLVSRWWTERKCRSEFGSDAYALELAKTADPEGAGDSRPIFVPGEYIAPEFANFFRDVAAHRHTHYWEPGGRGAGRSSAISLAIVHLIMNRPKIHAVVCRQVANTVRDSVFAQIIWAIDAFGLSDRFKVSRSRLQITRLDTEQNIYFRGLDDTYKIKGIKPPFGHIGALWVEEADQTDGEGALRTLRQSVMRGGEEFWCFESWNTPRSRKHWINERLEAAAGRPDVRIHHSTYLQLPAEWLGRPFIEEAEALRAADETAYRHEYLGEAVGYGGEIFQRLSVERIGDETISEFDNVRMGIDWGFAVDPLAFVKVHFDKTRKVLFVFDELVAKGLSDDEAARLLKARGVGGRSLLTADCADPKSIDNYRRLGFYIRGCSKFPGSLEHGVKFLQGLSLIVIDPARCPVAAREFTGYSLKKDSSGEYQPIINQVNDHTIDAVRYALDDEINAVRPASTEFISVL